MDDPELKVELTFDGGEPDWLIRPLGLMRNISTVRFVGDIKPKENGVGQARVLAQETVQCRDVEMEREGGKVDWMKMIE